MPVVCVRAVKKIILGGLVKKLLHKHLAPYKPAIAPAKKVVIVKRPHHGRRLAAEGVA